MTAGCLQLSKDAGDSEEIDVITDPKELKLNS